MESDKTSTYIKIGFAIGLVLVMGLSMLNQQSPVDVLVDLGKDIFVLLFFLLLAGAPLLLFAYIIILCFTNLDDNTSNFRASEVTKNKIASFFGLFVKDNSGEAGKKKKPKKKKQSQE